MHDNSSRGSRCGARFAPVGLALISGFASQNTSAARTSLFAAKAAPKLVAKPATASLHFKNDLFRLAQLPAELRGTEAATAETLGQEALEAYKNGDFVRAINLYGEAFLKSTDNP